MLRGAKTRSAISRGDLPPDEARGIESGSAESHVSPFTWRDGARPRRSRQLFGCLFQTSNSATFLRPSLNGNQPSSTDRSANPAQLPSSQPKFDSPRRVQDQGEPTANKVTEATM